MTTFREKSCQFGLPHVLNVSIFIWVHVTSYLALGPDFRSNCIPGKAFAYQFTSNGFYEAQPHLFNVIYGDFISLEITRI